MYPTLSFSRHILHDFIFSSFRTTNKTHAPPICHCEPLCGAAIHTALSLRLRACEAGSNPKNTIKTMQTCKLKKLLHLILEIIKFLTVKNDVFCYCKVWIASSCHASLAVLAMTEGGFLRLFSRIHFTLQKRFVYVIGMMDRAVIPVQ
jgi:hypothetical protein